MTLVDAAGREVARCLVNLSSDDVRACGRPLYVRKPRMMLQLIDAGRSWVLVYQASS